MRYGNELKVGVSIVLAVVVFYVGLRFFQDLPIFRGTFHLETEFEEANGLVAGNEVRVRGVTVGKVKEVRINPENNQVRVLFHIDNDINVPVGSYTEIDGFEAFGVIRVSLHLGAPGGPMLEEGDFVPSHTKADILGAITDRAPALITQVDSVLVSLDGTLGEARSLLAEPSSDLRTTLVTARQTMNTLNNLLREEKVRVDRVLAGAEELTGTLSEFARQRGDSLDVAFANLNSSLARLDNNMRTLESTMTTIDGIVTRIDEGEGTLGLLINDPTLYHKLDSTLNNINGLVTDFKQNPRKYLRELRLIDLF